MWGMGRVVREPGLNLMAREGGGDRSLSFALGVSLVLHGMLLLVAGVGYERWGQVPVERPAAPQVSGPVYIHAPVFGEAEATGTSLHALPGEQEMVAREGPQDQAFLRREEQAGAVDEALPPSPAALAPEPARRMRELEALAEPMPLRVESMQGLSPPRVEPRLPEALRAPAAAPEVAEAPAPPQAAAPSAAAPAGVVDPGPLSRSESDAFATATHSLDLRTGRVEARDGRQVRTVRPRLTLAGQLDLVALQYPPVVLKVTIDATGQVTRVDIHRSSGSNEIDLPCQRAMYGWWIEPPRDARGEPTGDLMYWRLNWR
jgi:TonB family protein